MLVAVMIPLPRVSSPLYTRSKSLASGGFKSYFAHKCFSAWATLFAATASELVSCVFMHRAEGFSRPGPACVAVLFYALSFAGFNLSLRALEISVAYAVWSAVVMAGLALIGMTCFGESVSAAKVLGIAAIVAGTAILSLAGVSS